MVKVLNYNVVKKFNNRKDAIEFYKKCIANSDGAEQDRYINILDMLIYTDEDIVYDNEESYIRYINNK